MITQRSMVVGQNIRSSLLIEGSCFCVTRDNVTHCFLIVSFISVEEGGIARIQTILWLPRYSWLLPVMLWPRARDSRKKKGLSPA
ncbi:hypothetical protein CEXT_316391 [Caerostris extrusa]|uniref:Uncharacterized protein n=1 Tax=Caerostris extrusa TaxID=172846 RepID=A0AAV4VLQ1_CAEEX|nr:hypothetical protein CEXT_316391 [Caerostris extrusa]